MGEQGQSLFRLIVMSSYPGQGLSTGELIFALGKNLEEKLARYAPPTNLFRPIAERAQPVPTFRFRRGGSGVLILIRSS